MRRSTRNAARSKALPPIHTYDLSQQTLAGYWQQTVGLLPTTDFSYGARVQNTSLSARDRFDPFAPNCAISLMQRRRRRSTAAKRNTRCISASSIASTTCSRCSAAPPARSVRRTSMSAWRRVRRSTPSSSASRRLQAEDPDLARRRRRLPHQGRPHSRCNRASTTWTSRTRSISIPVLFFNVNLDPTRRYGSETSASLRVSDTVLLRGGMAYTRAVFREGPFAGNDVPLVSRYTGSAGVTWNIWQNYLVARRHACAPGANASWTTIRPIPSADSGQRNGRFQAERRLRALLLVDLRQQYLQRAVLRLRGGEHVHAGPLLGLSAAGPNLHGEGRRDVLTARPVRSLAGPRCRRATAGAMHGASRPFDTTMADSSP